ncbi:MAG: ribosome silencing factor [Pseudomonadales bacterium]|jgi:ribosome-associated protein|nr:ribosome silencing factor [Pseudomonadales bacterium]MDP6472642.1 ribosome silencing factor [Pseudomonadales bacterium]MDP6829080.1 ribosome silencing factor [Pseudomonadales bacterium]MDP6971376.1 ribosome silencing factor [Pseudomonadales bacterium]|tara:strand:- start:2827 stop:3195 length:369 start_codon:yes stop_codon:yes gene_type:complete
MDTTENRLKAEALRDHLIAVIEDRKGRDVTTLDVRKLTDVTDFMIIVSGTSGRHVKALVDYVVDAAKRAGLRPLGIEGRETNEWVLIDLGDVLVHVMQVQVREFYDLERLWDHLPVDSETIV